MGGQSAPQPSAAEQQLQQSQAELLQQQRQIIEEQRAQQRILLPFLAEQEGFDITTDDNGNITSIKKKFSADDAKRQELESGFLDRSLKALKGELPVDPALESSLETSEQALREKLQAQFGAGYETSSPAIETLGEFNKNKELLREGARTGQLTLSEQLGLTREQQRQFTQGGAMDALQGSAVGAPMTFAGAFGQVARGYGQAQQPYLQNRQMQAQMSMANQDRLYRLIGAGIGAGGQAGSAAIMFSDPELKDDVVPVGMTRDGLPIYAYTLKTTGERFLGVMSPDVEAILPEAVLQKQGWDVVDYGAL